ncbi:MAG TPA: polysaccharide deacetylase family protein [Acetobacteraceae bacterium]|nr:polysaccharide deacetylase family protein [Acetobacteraceae bacterium]
MFDLTLSFDNGPEPDVTPGVLSVLRERGIRASFFVIGEKLARPECLALARQAREEGHWIGNHTWTHTIPLGERAEPDIAEMEIGRTQKVIGDLAHPDRLFRPFGGGGHLDSRLLNARVVTFLQNGRYSSVLWNAIPRDWEDPEGWVERALRQCAAQPWTLMVLHDLPTGAMARLPHFLDRIAAAGGRIRQDFPPDCVPILRGQIRAQIESYVAPEISVDAG